MSETAGGVALQATLDYEPAIRALEAFRAEIDRVEAAGAKIEQTARSIAAAAGSFQEVSQGAQTAVAEIEAVTQRVNQLRQAEAQEAAEAVAGTEAKSRSRSKLTDEEREAAAAYISQANAAAAAQKLNAAAAAQAAKDQAAAQSAAAAAARADAQTADAIERELLAGRVAANKAADAAILAERQDFLAQQSAAEKAAAAASKASRADATTADAIERQMAQDAAAAQLASDRAILAERADAAAQQSANARRAMADNQQVYLLEQELAKTSAAQVAASDAGILAEREERFKREAALAAEAAAAQKAMQTAETARAVDARASASYEVAGLETKLRMLQRIELAERTSGTRVSENPTLAAQFPSSAIRDYTAVGSAYVTAHQLGAELGKIGSAGTTAAAGLKATANEAREVVTIGKDLVTGEWSRLGGSLTRLLTISGVFDGILGPLGIGILGVGSAIGVMAAAALQGAEEQTKLNLAVAMTGGSAGVTADALEDMGARIAASGGNISTVRETILALAQTGQVSAAQIENVTNAIKLVGEAGGDTNAALKDFTGLLDKPTQSALKLNEQVHFLTTGLYEQIKALEDAGKTTDAARVAMDAYADTLSGRMQEVVADQGYIERGWHAIKDAASGAWDAMMGIGRDVGLAGQIAALEKQKQAAQNNPGFELGTQWTKQQDDDLSFKKMQLFAEQQEAAQHAQRVQEQSAQVSAQAWYDSFNQKFWTPAEHREHDIAEFDRAVAPLGLSPEQIQHGHDEINAKYKDRKAPRGRIDPTPYNAAQNDQQLAAAALKTAQDRLNIEKQLGYAIQEQQYAQVAQLQVAQENAAYEAQRQKILKEIANTASNRNNNPVARAQLLDQLGALKAQHDQKLQEIQLDYESQEVQRGIASAQLNINTIIKSRQTILQSMQTLYGSDAKYSQDRLDDLTEAATIQNAQAAQAQQMEQLKQSNASAEEISLARQANVLSLATQIYAIEQDRQKLLADNALSLQSIYQQTMNALEQQINALEKSRTTIYDSAVSGFSSGLTEANNSLFQSFKNPQAAKAFSWQGFTGTIGSSMYDSITKNLSNSLTETTLKQFQSILQATGVTSPADAARQKAQEDLATNTQSMAKALGVDIPAQLQQLIDLANGTTAPVGPVGNAALSEGSNGYGFNTSGGSTNTFSAAATDSYTNSNGSAALFGPTSTGLTGGTAGQSASMSQGIEGATSALNSLGQTGLQTFNLLGLNATQFSSLMYTGIVSATQGGMTAFKNFAVYAIEQLLQIYAMQKIVGLVGTLAGSFGATGSEAAGASATSTPDDLIAGYQRDGGIIHAANGYIDPRGIVSGPGGARDDKAGLFALSDGEAVLNAAAVSYYGVDTIKAMNQRAAGSARFGRAGGFADGGVVGGARPAVSGGGGSNISIGFDIDASSSGGGQQSGVQQAAQAGALQKQLESAVLGVFAKYSAPGGQIYKTVKQLTSL